MDLAKQDCPQWAFNSESWSVGAHVHLKGRLCTVFASFFRGESEGESSMDWALVDLTRNRYLYGALLDPGTPRGCVKLIDEGLLKEEPFVARAARELFERGRVPLPDRLLAEVPDFRPDQLDLHFGKNRLRRFPEGRYGLDLADDRVEVGCALVLTPARPAVHRGATAGYFVPRCTVTGEIRIDGEDVPVEEGIGWYEHDLPRHPSATGADDSVRNRALLQLENGWDVAVFEAFDTADAERTPERFAVVVGPEGTAHAHARVSFKPSALWTSIRTYNEYGTSWRIDVPDAALSLLVECELPDQERVTLLSAAWKGRMRVTGTMRGTPVRGTGYWEHLGPPRVQTQDDLFAAVSRETRRGLESLLPMPTHAEAALALVGSNAHQHYLDGVDLQQFERTVVAPVRHVIDAGGKAWRSYGFLACVDAAGGDSNRFRHWLALPELLHVGSLIVDDVEDASSVRRGKQAVHLGWGKPLAINAGTACYFFAQLPVLADDLPDALRARVYETYFQVMRAAHAGQALDIDGFASGVPDTLASGDGKALERRVLAAHRLKSGVPAAGLGRIAAHLAGAADAVADGLGSLFEAYGLAFQIVDDVLNLRGFRRDLKTRAEDISSGKVTFPIACAFSRLGLTERCELWAIVSSNTTDGERLARAVALVDECGALRHSERTARDLVEDAWQRIDPLLADTQIKVRLRAFGWFLLERHY